MSEHTEEPVNDQEPQVEWDLVACGSDPVTGKRRCTYSWTDGTREMFVEGEHPIHRKGLGHLMRPGEPYPIGPPDPDAPRKDA